MPVRSMLARSMLVPRFSICRTIPELKHVPAEVSDRLVRWVRCQRRESVTAMWITGTVAGLIATFIGLILAVKLTSYGVGAGLLDATAMLIFTFTPPALTIALLRFVWLRVLIRQEIARGFCPWCGYSLRGLEWVHDVTVCPECGGNAYLMRHEIFEKSSAIAPDLPVSS